MGIIELTVTACIHLVRSNLNDLKPVSIGSGVIIKYKERFFICTVSHFSDYPDENIGIVTGRVKNNQTEIYYLGDFSYMTKIVFEDMPDAEDLVYCIENPDQSGDKLDIAFREISLLENIVQDKKEFDLNGIGKITVNEGGKSMVIVDDDYQIDTYQQCSFFGRIKPDFENGILNFQEALYWGLPIKSIGDEFVELDLGAPINDHKRFKGCSGAPIIDTRGHLVGLVTHGENDTTKSSIYGFRFDKIKQWIDLMYFKEPIAGM
ncbi:hypothetical protein QYS49_11970 [Marivirga salinae]|uniref:Peptidase S1 domain-containing protein n=1 Tax=Marivirga salinarum TaxID=3059078 RepID=A0AA49J9Q2_9BACT|nr:hypothetical protein [Marivirga sp. BDSF4-3]WKK77737.1 hypothetical protein QYS49_11970 [Marivirga sp. BDSF4-3]